MDSESPPAADADRGAAARPEGGALPRVLAKRAEFLAASRAARAASPGFVLQARARGDGAPLRVGFTCSKKVGNAVARNRAKRRLREIARLELGAAGRAGWDYVLVGRRETTAELPFDRLRADLRAALARVHGGRA